ncbi:unnamed protein product [Cylicocyclus nassatus]|uniref:Major sperm protein n=1 Tax=Cylicocyclus nassatus TaxID=53992 RepID=A0AA36DPA3_CYLNA|nr:unnamed protein product [Cylicocyclus nassatus]
MNIIRHKSSVKSQMMSILSANLSEDGCRAMMLPTIGILMMHIITLYLMVICKTAKKDLNRKAAGRTPKNATPVIKKEQQKEGEEKKEKAEENKSLQNDGDKTALEAEKKDENQKGDEQQQKDKSNKAKQGEKKEEMGDKNEDKEAVKKEDKSKPKGENVEKNEVKQEQEREKDKHEDVPPGEVKDKKEDDGKPDKLETEKKDVKDQEEKKSEKGGDNNHIEMKEEETQVVDPGESQGTPSLHKENANNNLTDAALTIYPKEIRWEYEQGQQNIRIKNDTKYRFAFKFRCTDNALYSVSPVMDFVDAGKFVNVAVVRAKGPFKKDKFVICSKQVSEDEKDAYAVFKTGTPHIDTVSMDQLVRA